MSLIRLLSIRTGKDFEKILADILINVGGVLRNVLVEIVACFLRN